MSENNKVDIKKIDVIKDFNIQNNEEKILFDSSLDFEPLTMFGGLVERRPWFKNHQLSIDWVKDDEDVVIDENENIVFIRLKKQLDKDDRSKFEIENGHLIKDFYINNYSFPFSVLLNPKAFKDYKNLNSNRTTLKFNVEAQLDEKSDKKVKHLIELNYQLTKYNPIPKAQFILDDSFTNGFEHVKDDKVLLGVLEVENDSEFIYAHDLSFKVTVADKDKGKEPIYYFGEVGEYEQTNPKFDMGEGLRSSQEKAQPVLTAKLFGESVVKVDRHNAQNTLKIPVYINMNMLQNPINESTQKLVFSFEYTINHNTNYHSIESSYKLLKDTRTTDLMSFLQIGGRSEVLKPGVFDTKSKRQWIKNMRGSLRCFTIRLGNFAENGADKQGAVKIENLNFSFQKDTSSPSDIQLSNGKALDTLFEISNYNSKEFIFPDDIDSYKDFDIKFRHTSIEDIPHDRLFFNCILSFDYAILDDYNNPDTLPSGEEMEHFETKIFLELEKYPGPYWLAVDFGTAAIVAAGSGGDDQEVVINLQESLKNYLINRNLDVNYIEGNAPEYGSTFLSSSLMFKDGGYLNTTDADNETVALSPLDNEINQDRLLPYIKSLIGTETVPNFNGIYNDFYYYDENGVERNFQTKPIATQEVVTQAYDLLFKKFIIPQLEANQLSDDLNKLILTVPNSFTPRHITEIRNIIHAKYPEFKQQYLTFTTESDAVASFYLKNWNDLNKGRSDEQKNSVSSNEEYTLVYDMGAGTLDLTYFKIKNLPNNDKKITVIGRLGSTIAGNYLDYVIAKWIYNKYKSEFLGDLIRPSTKQMVANAADYKKIIEQKIKPNLLSLEIPFELEADYIQNSNDNSNKIEIDISDFFDSEEFKEYLFKNSDVILENLFSIASPEEFSQNNVRVDTVVFSGRGVQTAYLKDAVKSGIQKLVDNDDIHYIELSDENLKSAVVEGALQYALLYKQGGSRVSFESNNLQAKYGVLYRKPSNGRWAFKELLNPTTKPISGQPIYLDGNMIYEYDTEVHCAEDINGYSVRRPLAVDFSATSRGYFIQTFSLDPAKDANEGNFEFISKMMSISNNLFTPDQVRAVPFRVVITKTNAMRIFYGDYENDDTDPLVVNPEDDKAFIRSMWPLIVE